MEKLRKSSYLIPVKLEQEKGKYMIIHGYTGAIDIVTEELLKKLKSETGIIELSDNILNTLIKRGYLTEKTPNEERAYVNRLVCALHKKDKILRTSFTWVVTYNCNFRCPYCFEERHNKDGKGQIVFTKEQVDNAYQAIENIQYKKGKNNIMVLYGGEPLLAQNKDIVTYIVREGKSKGYKFQAITNGYELDSYIDLLNPDDIYKLQITIDGPREIHNQRRIHYKCNDTFDKIMYNIKLALDLQVEVVVRVNVDSDNIQNLAKLKEFFTHLEFDSYSNFSMYSAVLRDYETISPQEHENLDFISAESYVSGHKQENMQETCYDYGISKMFYNAMSENKAVAFRSFFCLAQVGGYVLAPLGKIYPCWEVIGDNRFLIGDFTKNEIQWYDESLKKWREFDVTKQEQCSHCQYALFCGGGCPAHALSGKNTHCAFFRKIFNNAVNMAYMKFIKQSINNN